MWIEREVHGHVLKSMIFKYASETKWSHEVLHILIFIYYSIRYKGIPESRALSLQVSMSDLRSESHKEWWAREEISHKVRRCCTKEWIERLLLLLLSSLLLFLSRLMLLSLSCLLLLLLSLFFCLLCSFPFFSTDRRCSINIRSRSIIEIHSIMWLLLIVSLKNYSILLISSSFLFIYLGCLICTSTGNSLIELLDNLSSWTLVDDLCKALSTLVTLEHFKGWNHLVELFLTVVTEISSLDQTIRDFLFFLRRGLLNGQRGAFINLHFIFFLVILHFLVRNF
jgi:hypothetical protein